MLNTLKALNFTLKRLITLKVVPLKNIPNSSAIPSQREIKRFQQRSGVVKRHWVHRTTKVVTYRKSSRNLKNFIDWVLLPADWRHFYFRLAYPICTVSLRGIEIATRQDKIRIFIVQQATLSSTRSVQVKYV